LFSRAHSTAQHRVMVVSAKGGVGKSTMTVNLAAALTARGLRVGIFDADIHGPNIPTLLGVTQKRDLSMGANPMAMLPVEARPDSLDMRPIKPFERYGLKVMSLGLLVGAQQTLNPVPQEVGRIVNMLLARVDWGKADVLLLDMPPGTGEPLNTLISEKLVDGVVLVTTRESLAHIDNGRLLSLLRARGVPIFGVVENMTHVVCPNCGELVELYPAPAADEPVYANTPILAQIPFHPHLIHQRGAAPLPLQPIESPVKNALLDLADNIMTLLNIG
jgi:ATP-binding protein involved in chromosome partitioning